MAKNTKADGTNTTNGDIPVVHPDNMGVGLKWNASTKKYDVAIAAGQPITANEFGELVVRVSDLEDNLIRVIDGKLYYGTKSRTELANLYVDAVNGVDQDPLKVKGAGTRANPLRTFKYAATLAERGTARVIRLKENQDHFVNQSQYFGIKSGSLSVESYGEIYDSYYSHYNRNNYLATKAMVESGQEARLVFTGASPFPYLDPTDDFDRLEIKCFYTEQNLVLQFYGVRLVNDLGFNFKVSVRKATVGNIRDVNVNPYRIAMGQGSRINLINARVSTIGKPNITGDGEETSEIMKQGNLKQKDGRGLYHVSMFYGLGQDIYVRGLLLDTAECYLYGTHGWIGMYGSDTTVNNQGINSIPDLTKRIYGTVFDKLADGVEQIIVPTTTIPTSYWKF